MRKCRKLLKLEQDELGAILGVSGSLISKWEKDARDPKYSQVKHLERIAPVPEGWLSRSKCSDVIDLRVIPGEAKSHELLGQLRLPMLTLLEA